MQNDPNGHVKIAHIIRAVCKEWGVTELEVKARNAKSPRKVTDARSAICYIAKKKGKVKISGFILGAILGVERFQVSKYVKRMSKDIQQYPDIKLKVEFAILNILFLTNEISLDFTDRSIVETRGQKEKDAYAERIIHTVKGAIENRKHRQIISGMLIRKLIAGVRYSEIGGYLGMAEFEAKELVEGGKFWIEKEDDEFNRAYESCLSLLTKNRRNKAA